LSYLFLALVAGFENLSLIRLSWLMLPVGLARLQACLSEVSWFTTLETMTPTATIRTRYNRLGSRLLSVGKVKIFLSLILGQLSH
jgi:hypothetical protein